MQRARIGGFRAIGLGFSALRRNLPLWVFGLSSDALVAAMRMVLLFAGSAAAAQRFASALGGGEARDLGELLGNAFASAFSEQLWLPIALTWLCLEVLGAVLRVVYLAAAVVDASEALKEPGRNHEPVLAAASHVLPRAVVASLWLVVLDVIAALSRGTLFIASLLIVGRAFSVHKHGFAASFAGALAITLALLIALFVDLFSRVYRVRALRHLEVGALAAAYDAGALLGRRLGTLILISVLGLLLGIAGNMLAGSPGALAGMLGTKALFLGTLLRLFGAMLAAAWAAGVELVLVGAVCALDLESTDELPLPPPPPEPVLVAQPVVPAQEVLIAQVIEPKPGS